VVFHKPCSPLAGITLNALGLRLVLITSSAKQFTLTATKIQFQTEEFDTIQLL
jgi:hypothetical protein